MVRLILLAGLVAALAQAQDAARSVDAATDMVARDVDNTAAAVLADRPNRFAKRKAIDVVVATATVVGAAAGVVIAGNSAVDLYDNIAAKIKQKSNANSCTLIYGTDNDDGYYEGYAYYASTTNKNCDTTSELKTIQAAVRTCATDLHNRGAVSGCCKFSHGGTWTGHLQLTANPSKYPATSVPC